MRKESSKLAAKLGIVIVCIVALSFPSAKTGAQHPAEPRGGCHYTGDWRDVCTFAVGGDQYWISNCAPGDVAGNPCTGPAPLE